MNIFEKIIECVNDTIRQVEKEYSVPCTTCTNGYNNGWIACSERLPNEEEMKRAYCKNKYGCEFIVMIDGATKPTTLYRTIDGFWLDEHRHIYNVVAWQPLPAPYKQI